MGKNADDIGLPTDFPIEPFQRIGGRDLFPMFVGEAHIRENIVLGIGQETSRLRKAALQMVHHPGQFGPGRVQIRLGKDRAHESRDHRLGVLRNVHQEVAHKVHATPLPTRSLENLANRGLEADMGVAHDQLDSTETPGHAISQKRGPEGGLFTETDVKGVYLAFVRQVLP